MQVQFLPQLPMTGTLVTEPVQGETSVADFLQFWLTLLGQAEKDAIPAEVLPEEGEPEKALPELPELWVSLIYPQLVQLTITETSDNPEAVMQLVENTPVLTFNAALDPPLTGVLNQVDTEAGVNNEAFTVPLPVEIETEAMESNRENIPVLEQEKPAAGVVANDLPSVGDKAASPEEVSKGINLAQGVDGTAANDRETAEAFSALTQQTQQLQEGRPAAQAQEPWEQNTETAQVQVKEPVFTPRIFIETDAVTETAAEKFPLAIQSEAEAAQQAENSQFADARAALALNDLPVVSGDDFAANVTEQVWESILVANLPQGEKKLFVRLKPESLGQVEIHLRLNAKQQLVAHVMTDNFQVKQALEATLGQLRERLQAQQITVTEFTVTLGQEQSQAQQHNPWQQNHYPWQKYSPPSGGARESLTGEPDYPEGPVRTHDLWPRTVDLRA